MCSPTCACDPDCQRTVECNLRAPESSDAGTATLNGLSLASDGGWAVGDTQTLVRYQNGTWTRRAGPSGNDPYTLNDVHLVDQSNGWAVGSWSINVAGTSYTYGMALKLVNGVWTLTQNSLGWGLRSIDLVDANNGWAVGYKGQITRIQAGSYSPLYGALTTGQLNGVDVVDTQTGWAVGANGLIRRLQAGSWTTISSPTSETLTDVVLVDAENGWAVGTRGTVLRLANGTWTVVAAVTNHDLKSVTIGSGGTVWAVGENSTVLRYTGVTWEQCYYGATSEPWLYSVSSDGTETWAVGSRATRRRLE